jgi:hypothetical protein
MIKTTMYFGRNITYRGKNQEAIDDEVTYANWIGFLEQVVDKHFSGYTWIDANGVWMGEKEETFILEIIHEKAAEHATAIADIVKEYKELYNQEAVGVTIQELNFRLM